MAWAGSANASGPFNFRGCDLTARMPPRHGGSPGAIPGNRTNHFHVGRAPACATESPKLSLLGAAPRRPANSLGPWLKSEAPALQAVLSGSVTRRTPPSFAWNPSKARFQAKDVLHSPWRRRTFLEPDSKLWMAGHVLHLCDRELESYRANLHWSHCGSTSSARGAQWWQVSTHIQVRTVEDQTVCGV